MKKKRGKSTTKSRNISARSKPPEFKQSTEQKIKIFANIIVDRIIEEEQLYKERLKTNPNAKRIYENCDCIKCRKKRLRSAIAKGKLTCSRFRSR